MFATPFLLVPAVIRVLLAVVGLVVIGIRSRGVARGVGLTACALLVLSGVTAIVYAVAVPVLTRGGGSVAQSLASLGVLTLVGSVFQLVGIALLIVAVCVRPNPSGGSAVGGYPRPAQPYGGSVPPPPPPPPGTPAM